MQRISLLFFVLVICFVTLAQSQAPAPQPDPEFKKLQVVVGRWIEDGEYKAGPWGRPGSKSVFEETGQMILGGHFLQVQDIVKGSPQDLWIIGYDPANKNYPAASYGIDGGIMPGTVTCDGKVWGYTSAKKISLGGTQYAMRFILTPGRRRDEPLGQSRGLSRRQDLATIR